MTEPTKPRRLQFDPTINAGHILTFISLMVAGFMTFSAVDKRIVVLEEAKNYQKHRDDLQDSSITEKLIEIKDRVGEIKRGVDELQREQRKH